MNTIAQQRLSELESSIAEAATAIRSNGLAIGQALCEIRDKRLWKDGFPSWNQYLQERANALIGKSFGQAVKYIRAAEIFRRIPESKIAGDLTPKHLLEIGRLAPNIGKDSGGKEKDYSRIPKVAVSRVLNQAHELAGGKTPSVGELRKSVDQELGIDRAARAAELRQQWEDARKRYIETELETSKLSNHLIQLTRDLRRWADSLEAINPQTCVTEDLFPHDISTAEEELARLAKLMRRFRDMVDLNRETAAVRCADQQRIAADATE